MKILTDIGHPAHVHLFKQFARIMANKNHQVLFTTRNKEMTLQLLDFYRFDFVSFGKPYKKIVGKLWGLMKFDCLLMKTALRYKPDIFVCPGSFYAAHVARVLRKPSITLEDTGNMEQVRLYKHFTHTILVSTAFKKDLGKRQVVYKGYHELAYLHPRYFTPDPGVRELLGVKAADRYVIVRFVSWHATHDRGQAGFPLEQKRKIIKELSKYARIFISSESGLPPELQEYAIHIPPERMHDALAFACLYIGEGATMASECAVLGTPAIYVNSITAGTLEEQETYGLIFGFRNADGVLEKAIQLLKTPHLKKEWQKRRQEMLSDKIDVTAFLVWFVENYPGSVKIMKDNPGFQLRFK